MWPWFVSLLEFFAPKNSNGNSCVLDQRLRWKWFCYTSLFSWNGFSAARFSIWGWEVETIFSTYYKRMQNIFSCKYGVLRWCQVHISFERVSILPTHSKSNALCDWLNRTRFEEAKKKANTALHMVKKFPVNGFLTWPGELYAQLHSRQVYVCSSLSFVMVTVLVLGVLLLCSLWSYRVGYLLSNWEFDEKGHSHAGRRHSFQLGNQSFSLILTCF